MADVALEFGDFVTYLESELNIEVPRPAEDLVFGVDLEMDSIAMLEMVVAIEELGAELPADIFLTARSLGDVYEQYLRAADLGHDQVAPEMRL